MLEQQTFPGAYSKDEKQIATRLLDSLKEETLSYSSNWKASWLLSDIHSLDWTIGSSMSHFVDGQWHEVRHFHWDYRLPNGTSLACPSNILMREAAQKVGFLWRLPPAPHVNNTQGLLSQLYSLSVLIRWMYLNEKIYDPAHQTFNRLDNIGLKQFSRRFLEGGVPWVLGYPWTMLEAWFRNALNKTLPDTIRINPFSIEETDRTEISKWLSDNDYYHKTSKDNARFIDRSKIAENLNFELQTIKSHARFSALLRLFEPTLDGPLMIGREKRREYPSHRVPLVKDAQRALRPHSSGAYPAMLSALFRTRIHLKEFIPDTTDIHVSQVTAILDRNQKINEHTPWMPIKVALRYTNEALKWISLYGRDLVDFYLYACKSLKAAGLFGVSYKNINYVQKREDFVKNLEQPESLRDLNIDGWMTKTMTGNSASEFLEFRANPSLNDALSVFIGASILLLSILKPVRNCEVRDLNRDCVRHAKRDGYWLRQTIAKRTYGGQRSVDELPIPYIVGEALQTIDLLGQGLRQMTGSLEATTKNSLYFVPDRDVSDSLQAGPLSVARINSYLDRFCDWINLDCDEYGRRWYIRTHESRKCFLLTFFWCYRYASLEAARWVAGHSDSRDVYAYIEANFPGMELPAVEAQYATEQLRAYMSGDVAEAENVRELERAVCQHFKVTSISILSDTELSDWLEIAFSRGTYEIEPYSVKVANSISETHICFRINEEIDDARANQI
ncbi:hypothetical protein DR64_1210 [Paraburkholderia xenovorans LB400]|uniref:Integrase n=1 Tax=Paraburkholderia xenovorans (strain LB400) TaxID=266265 RepID=Q143L5_PARXL|nr:hypothetical protein [Paraburkholderia xenovorans]ABE29474.1 hypothetical protein Bxe_A3511 [Paraburkholderia xenovorans LB400]AIP32872.1 hypothetical protein DR64_1210 [Paraburkholderia xenovorans LB400]